MKGLKTNFAHHDSVHFEDAGVVTLRFINGAIGTINYSINAYKENMEGSLILIAEKGSGKIGGRYLNTLEYLRIDGPALPEIPSQDNFNDYGAYQGSMSNHDKVYDAFVKSLLSDSPYSRQGASFEAYKSVEIIEKIYEQSKAYEYKFQNLGNFRGCYLWRKRACGATGESVWLYARG